MPALTHEQFLQRPVLLHLQHVILNHLKFSFLFIALVGQLVPVAQRFSAVACSADVQGSIPAQYLFFNFFPQKT